eukprot:CAMPEP_0196743116 /NCGR_PEP_ID=MMETSP1091-20130531/50850_1 /TAXON_ID=302021 /ORGANISM="Rhodomonas sp., Strain CCMP768" /LENGTH=162 /DNA_ID=CAMNT_0042089373 /DNA_START=115 /DNA_END=599 /DNA_ORIENTATION=-
MAVIARSPCRARSRSLHLSMQFPTFIPAQPALCSDSQSTSAKARKHVNLLFLDKVKFDLPVSVESTQEAAMEVPLECQEWDMPFNTNAARTARRKDCGHLTRFLSRLCQQASSNFELEITTVHYAMAPIPTKRPTYAEDMSMLCDLGPSRRLALFEHEAKGL